MDVLIYILVFGGVLYFYGNYSNASAFWLLVGSGALFLGALWLVEQAKKNKNPR